MLQLVRLGVARKGGIWHSTQFETRSQNFPLLRRTPNRTAVVPARKIGTIRSMPQDARALLRRIDELVVNPSLVSLLDY